MAGERRITTSTSPLDRARVHSPATFNERIDRATEARVHRLAAQPRAAITQRIEALERETDVERLLQINASLLAFTGLALGVTVNRKWLLLPGIVLPFLFQHALQGWCPPLLAFRALGVRTAREIDAEKYALKALRGDFESVPAAGSDPGQRAREALQVAST